jgi:hypothetical protein
MLKLGNHSLVGGLLGVDFVARQSMGSNQQVYFEDPKS